MKEQTMQKYTNGTSNYELLSLFIEYSILLEMTDDIKPIATKELKKFLNTLEIRLDKYVNPVMESLTAVDTNDIYALLLKEARNLYITETVVESIYNLLLTMEKRIIEDIKDYNRTILKLKFYITGYRTLLEKYYKPVKYEELQKLNLDDYV